MLCMNLLEQEQEDRNMYSLWVDISYLYRPSVSRYQLRRNMNLSDSESPRMCGVVSRDWAYLGGVSLFGKSDKKSITSFTNVRKKYHFLHKCQKKCIPVSILC